MCMQDDQNGRYSFQHTVFKFGRKKINSILSVINQDELPKFSIKKVQNKWVPGQQQLP